MDYSQLALAELEVLAERPKTDIEPLYDAIDLAIAWALYDKLLNGELTTKKSDD